MLTVDYEVGRRDKSVNAWTDSVLGPHTSQRGDLPLDHHDPLFIINTQSGRQSSLSRKNKLDICLVDSLVLIHELMNLRWRFQAEIINVNSSWERKLYTSRIRMLASNVSNSNLTVARCWAVSTVASSFTRVHIQQRWTFATIAFCLTTPAAKVVIVVTKAGSPAGQTSVDWLG